MHHTASNMPVYVYICALWCEVANIQSVFTPGPTALQPLAAALRAALALDNIITAVWAEGEP